MDGPIVEEMLDEWLGGIGKGNGNGNGKKRSVSELHRHIDITRETD